ncbi:MAG: hypothetical protein A2Z34_04965 [Planctomycetes bacterium RBG_16_59_8]|nr:MAG: hypothetical protein A2Z34_04965 [Planctomycetes bacterium RBG_16_59_8]
MLSTKAINDLKVSVVVDGTTYSTAFTAKPKFNAEVSDTESLTYYFLGEGIGLVPFPSKLDAGSMGFEWSIPATGFLDFVPSHIFLTDILVDISSGLMKGDFVSIGGDMVWSPDGPTALFVPYPGEGIGAVDQVFKVTRPESAWWFRADGIGTATIVTGIVTDAGNVFGLPINDKLEVQYPSR